MPSANLTLPTSLARVCATDTNLPLSGGTPAGGTWSGPGVTGSNFDPLSVGAGTYTITYTYIDANGCEADAPADIIVDPAPNVTLPITFQDENCGCLLYTSPSPRDKRQSRMPSSA